MAGLNVIVKTTRKCNLNCVYCHDRRVVSEEISFTTLANLISKALNYCKKTNQSVDFIWHGGEPLLKGLDFYKKAVYLEQILNDAQIVVRNSIQTNGTLVTDEWCRFFLDHDFSVGVSYDGLFHNENRRLGHSESIEQTIGGIELLKKWNIDFGVLAVVEKKMASCDHSIEEIVSSFTKLNCTNFAFQQVQPYLENINDEYLCDSKYYSFLLKIMCHLYIGKERSVEIREIENVVKGLKERKGFMCYSNGCCVDHTYTIESDGGIFPCDKFSISKRNLVGNINTDTFMSIRRNGNFRLLQRIMFSYQEQCRGCEFYEICKGGCMFNNFLLSALGKEFSQSGCKLRKFIHEIEVRMASNI